MLISAVPILWALTMHEFMHAWTALRCGDDTALLMGRVTLNPFRHLDVMGTVCLFVAGFGWAKPVPVNTGMLRRPGLDNILVSIAGPGSNLVLAIVLCLVFRGLALGFSMEDVVGWSRIWHVLLLMGMVAAWINFALCLFNLLPIPPLDGHHVVRELLPPGESRERFAQFCRYGPIVLMVLVFIYRAPLDFLFGLIRPMIKFVAGPDGFGLMVLARELVLK